MHAAQLRVELSQSRREQQEYLKNVELARVLDKRAERKRKAGGDTVEEKPAGKRREEGSSASVEPKQHRKKRKKEDRAPTSSDAKLESVLGSIF